MEERTARDTHRRVTRGPLSVVALVALVALLAVACASQPAPATAAPVVTAAAATPPDAGEPAIAVDAAGVDASPAPVEVGSDAPASLEPPIEKCGTCNGEVRTAGGPEPHRLYCLCRTHDNGKRCIDGKECEGSCVTDGKTYQVVRTDADGTVYGYRVGQCSEFLGKRGCGPNIPEGATDGGPYQLRGRHFHILYAPCLVD
jgi:hypothetical protein